MTAPRTVLFVEGSSGFGGSTVGLARLVGGLDRARWTPLVAVAHESQRAYLQRQGLGPDGATVGVVAPPVPSGTRLGTALSLARYVRRLRAFSRGLGVELVHGNNAVSINAGAVLLARWLRVPCVVKQRGFEWASPLNRRLVSMVDVFLPDSEAVCDRLRGLGATDDRIHVTYCALDPDEFVPDKSRDVLRERLDLTAFAGSSSLVGMVGCLVDWKGHDVLLDAVARLRGDGRDVRAVLVGDTPTGAPDPWSRSLRQRAERPDLRGRVMFAGHHDDVAPWLGALDVCVHASTAPEPFGTVCAEALAAAVPLVAARDGGPPEYVLDGETGLLHTPGDAADLARAIARLLDDSGLARRMAAAGRALVRTRFSTPTHVAATTAVYERVLAGRDA